MTDKPGEGVLCDVPWCGAPVTHKRNPWGLVRHSLVRRAGLPPSTCCHTFRATGITAYLANGGTLNHAQRIAGHASPKTTKLYDRTADTVSVDEIERIVI